ncbi:sigma-54-dependent Fis family transcriptional regulator [Natranaerofaba carboxydovora]|uniref:sigma-54-dependent Fis family transcriptional regulator n=1 Tax=Natranaerofaba carboxydovora TaxID=2742683 RepID=UPI001F12DB3A|nr:sigma-54-dependent Fis family transcriptional regulator [Natranaerofaba carboxydovora]UMZ74030.1 Limonene hydroxylase [Natranaerofaba carboxydovora]
MYVGTTKQFLTGKFVVDSGIKSKDILYKCENVLYPGDTFYHAIKLLENQDKLDGLPVVNKIEEPIGLLTKTDILNALAKGYELDTKIDPFINSEVWVINEAVVLEKFIDIAAKNPHGYVIVVNKNNKLSGVITKEDLISTLFNHIDSLLNQMNSIGKNIYNGIIVSDTEGTIININKAAEKIFDVSASCVRGSDLSSYAPNIDESVKSVVETEKQVVAQKVSINDKRYFINVTPIVDKKKVVGTITTLQDIHDLENLASELQAYKNIASTLETVLNIDSDGIVVIDNKGKIKFSNTAFGEFVEESNKNLLDSHINDVIEECKLGQVTKTGKPFKNKIGDYQNKRYIQSGIPIEENGKPIGAVGKMIFNNFKDIIELAELIDSMNNKLAYYEKEIQKQRSTDENIITSNDKMKRILGLAKDAAKHDSTVLIRGESGTGKDLLAQTIHVNSKRSSNRLVTINCAGIPENLLESELFGYEEGAFTGAKKKGKPGKFEIAHKGTVFLDEIGDMPLSLQAKLLRVLQDKKFERVGGINQIESDIRIIAATNQDIEKKIEEGSFRADLYYRLNVISFTIPPLRNRIEDIPLLVSSFIKEFNEMFDKNIKGIGDDAIALMSNYSWPGNVRELKHTVERIINFCDDNEITTNDLPEFLIENAENIKQEKQVISKNNSTSNGKTIGKDEIMDALYKNKWNKTKTAKSLGISRVWLYKKIKEYEIEN